MADEIQIRLAEVKDADVLAKANMAMAWETERKRLDGDTIRQGVRAVFDETSPQSEPRHRGLSMSCTTTIFGPAPDAMYSR